MQAVPTRDQVGCLNLLDDEELATKQLLLSEALPDMLYKRENEHLLALYCLL